MPTDTTTDTALLDPPNLRLPELYAPVARVIPQAEWMS